MLAAVVGQLARQLIIKMNYFCGTALIQLTMSLEWSNVHTGYEELDLTK